MRILLLAMPDTVDMVDTFCRMPNLALASLAGSLGKHDVRILDLILYKPNIRAILDSTIRAFKPEMIGMSAMTFQFGTLLKVARHIRSPYPEIRLAAGGYHVTLLAEELARDPRDLPLDYLIRGEGETTFSELADSLGGGDPAPCNICGLSYRKNGAWAHNPARPLVDLATLPPPNRSARIAKNFYFYDLPIDVAETSRGCLFNCMFCSITKMYGRTFRPFPVERILADLKSIRAAGSAVVLLSDDNITGNAEHFHCICKAVADQGLNDMRYIVQVSAAGISKHPHLVPEMARANFTTAFVGFESMSASSLQFVKKPTSPDVNRRAASLLRSHGIAVVAGIIAGYPDDTRKSIIRNFRHIRDLKPDTVIAQYLTPYPKTEIREELLKEGLVVNEEDFRSYDGFSCNIRTRHLSRNRLYRLVRKELLKIYFFCFPMLRDNLLLKAHRLFFIRAMARSLGIRIVNIVKGRERLRSLDI